MPRPRFSDMLYDRRRELGLSIKQASNVLRLKEEVLIAFEEGDFESIPKSGYAQGMLSSYARYLGLNAKTVVNQFSADLVEHEHGIDSHEARRRNRQNRNNADGPLYQTPQAHVAGAQARGNGNRLYFESRGFLPTSGGFAGDMGDFATTSAARPRYATVSAAREERDDYPQGPTYHARVSGSATNAAPLGHSRSDTRRGGSQSRETYGRGSSGQWSGRSGAYETGSSGRRASTSRYGSERGGSSEDRRYASSSADSGRRSSRSGSRPQGTGARRHPATTSVRTATRPRDTAPRRDGVMGLVEEFLSDRTRVIYAGAALLGVILLVVIITSVSSCVRGDQTDEKTVAITATDEETTAEETTSTDLSKEEEEKARAEAAAAKAAETESSSSVRTLEVTVDDGEVTWIEIEYDGKSDIAETVTGPWNRTYTVRQSITISTNKPSAVTVMEGGKMLEFDDKSSGIGTISIQVAKKSDAEANDTASDGTNTDDAKKTDGEGAQTTDNGDGQGQDTASADQTGYDDWSADEYIYTEYGYYDQYGNFYEYE